MANRSPRGRTAVAVLPLLVTPVIFFFFLLLLLFPGCRSVPAAGPSRPRLVYVGSSTIGQFMAEAEPVYGRAGFVIDVAPESLGGETLVRERQADLAGVAREPDPESLELGLRATHIGTDSIAVIVNERNPIDELQLSQLRDIFTGRVRSWKQLGGPDLEIVPLVVAEESATRHVFRDIVLGPASYVGCRVVTPDHRMPMNVEEEPGAIGMISHSFLCAGGVVKVIAVEGNAPVPWNLNYPIVRPLYLLWWPDDPVVVDFIAWTSTREAEAVVLKCFGRRRHLAVPGDLGTIETP